MKYLILLFITISFAGDLAAENRQKNIDSLLKCLQTPINDTTKANLYNELSGYYIDQEDYRVAYKYALQANILSEKIDFKTGLSSSFRKFGGIALQQGDYPKALSNFLRASKIGNLNENFFANRGIANVYFVQGNYQSSLNYLFKALEYKKDDADIYFFIGNIYMYMEDYKIAIDNYRKALELNIKQNNKNGIATTINGIGNFYEYSGQQDSALVYYFKALKIAEEVNDSQVLSDIFGSIGDLYVKKGEFSKAILYEQKSLSMAYKSGYLVGAQQTEQKLNEIYEALGNKDKAYEHFKKYISIRDSLIGHESIKKTIRTEMNFQFEKERELAQKEEEKNNAIKQEELNNQRTLRNIFIIGFVLFALFSVFIFNRWRIIKRQKMIIEKQKKITEEHKKELTDNIQYAKRIQDAVTTHPSFIKELLPNSFVFDKPRDTVSGDFIFAEKIGEEIIIAVADCTNHSVSGAMMTILSHNLLGDAISNGNYIPSDILNYVNIAISQKFHQTESHNAKKESEIVKDGMDVIIIKLDLNNMKYQYCGAYNPLIFIRKNELIEIKADKLQLGQTKEKYKNNEGELMVGDMLYLSSDGYADQFSSNGKKFMKKKFKELLLSINEKSIHEQKNILEKTHSDWKNGQEQTDDILVMGIKI